FGHRAVGPADLEHQRLQTAPDGHRQAVVAVHRMTIDHQPSAGAVFGDDVGKRRQPLPPGLSFKLPPAQRAERLRDQDRVPHASLTINSWSAAWADVSNPSPNKPAWVGIDTQTPEQGSP